MPRKGRYLEKLVSSLEKVLDQRDSKIISPGFLRDRITSDQRELDVLVTSGEGHHKNIIAFECKEKTTKVGSPDIEAFHTKTCDLKINKAVMVSSSGFTKPAIRKANHYNISCLSIEDLECIPWLQTNFFIAHETKAESTHWTINGGIDLSGNKTFTEPDLKIFTSSGEPVTQDYLETKKKEVFNIDLIKSLEEGRHKKTFNFDKNEIVMIDSRTGKKLSILDYKLEITFDHTIRKYPIRKLEYTDNNRTGIALKAATAEISEGPSPGIALIKENKDRTITVHFIPDD